MKMEVVDLKKQFAEEERLLAAGLEIVRFFSFSSLSLFFLSNEAILTTSHLLI